MYKILYLPTGRFLSDSLPVDLTPNDDTFHTIEKAEHALKCNLDIKTNRDCKCGDIKNCWVCYNELIYPPIKEYFEIIECIDV